MIRSARSRRGLLRVGQLVVLIGLAGCLAYARHAERVRAAFVGLPGTELLQCIGPPHDSREMEDGVERVTYFWELEAGARPSDGPDAPLLPKGSFDATRPRGSSSGSLGHGALLQEPGFCRLDFHLRGGEVLAVEADGKDDRGLTADTDCLLMIEDCVAARVAQQKAAEAAEAAAR